MGVRLSLITIKRGDRGGDEVVVIVGRPDGQEVH